MDILTENKESRERALNYQISWISEHVTDIPMKDLEMIIRLAFGAGVAQGLDEAQRIFKQPFSQL